MVATVAMTTDGWFGATQESDGRGDEGRKEESNAVEDGEIGNVVDVARGDGRKDGGDGGREWWHRGGTENVGQWTLMTVGGRRGRG